MTLEAPANLAAIVTFTASPALQEGFDSTLTDVALDRLTVRSHHLAASRRFVGVPFTRHWVRTPVIRPLVDVERTTRLRTPTASFVPRFCALTVSCVSGVGVGVGVGVGAVMVND